MQKPNQPDPVEIDSLISMFGQAIEFWESHPSIGSLVRARLADACRDSRVRPVSGAQFRAAWETLDQSEQHRFALAVAGFDDEALIQRLDFFSQDGTALSLMERITKFCQRLPFLTLEVLRQSDIRLEEFARHYCADWQVPIAGEEATHSAARLNEIDFGRLMNEAEAARGSAKERMAYLRELQAKQEADRRPRRGKW